MLTAACLGGLLSTQANIVVNPSFESHPAFTKDGNTWDYFAAGAVTGWDPAGGASVIEIGLGSVYGVTGYDGDAVMELDSTANVTAAQVVTSAPASLKLEFLYALRKDVLPTSGELRVLWNNSVIATLQPALQAMTLYSTYVTAVAGNNTLAFEGWGTSDSYGAVIDAVSLVPEPSTYVAAALLGIPAVIGFARTTRRRQPAV